MFEPQSFSNAVKKNKSAYFIVFPPLNPVNINIFTYNEKVYSRNEDSQWREKIKKQNE